MQELLAPSQVEFFDSDWNRIGTKNSLGTIVLGITGIKVDEFEEACVAQKMSWASTRETTRIEDKAYSLMGLFGVNMPPLYGEGNKAFLRLQLEILKFSDDESIFAWQDEIDQSGGLFAASPEAFLESGNVYELESKVARPAYQMTNKGSYRISYLGV